MLFDLAAWVVILLVAWTVGRGVMALLRAGDLRPGDALICASWIGVVVLSLALLATSIVAPLTPVTGAVVALILAALGVAVVGSPARSRGPISVRRHRETALLAAGALALAIGAAALTSDAVTLYDSLVYHVGIVRWLREYGTVPGLALLHNRLGHASAWFTLAAPFDGGAVTNRTATVPLGVALVLAGLQAAIAMGRAVARRASVADWFFIVLAGAFIWAVVAHDVATPSPDVATNVLVAVAAWSVLVLAPRPADGVAFLPAGHALVPLILAVGAAGMKLFALPAAFVAAGFYVASVRASDSGASAFRAAAVAAGVAFVGLAPFLAANLAASGCVLFPSPIGCTRLPWSLGAAAAADYAEYIRDVARWDRRGNVPPNDATGWILPWISAHPVVTLLAAVSVVLSVHLLRRASRSGSPDTEPSTVAGLRTVVALGLVGIAFAAWQAPAPRFFYSAVLLIPALAAARCASTGFGSPVASRNPDVGSARFAGGFAATAVFIGLAYGIASQKLNVRSALVRGAPYFHVRGVDLIVPRAPQAQTRLFRWRVNDVDVLTPVPRPIADTLGYQSVIAHNAEFEKCSTAPLPCTPYVPNRDVRLRRPSRGLSSGFVRAGESDLAGSVATCLGEWSTGASPRPASLAVPAGPDDVRCRAPEGR